MALQIPMPDLPLSGLNRAIATGGNLFQQMINPQIQRENAERQWRQHLDSLALQREQMAHAKRNDDIQRAILEQQYQHLKNTNDPIFKFKQFQAIQDLIAGKAPQSGGLSLPTEEIGEGLGAFSPMGLEEAQTSAKTNKEQENTGGMNLDALRQHPALRGWFKHEFGYDPLAPTPQTPQEKKDSALDLFKEKEKIKLQSKGGTAPTNTVLTQNQQAIQAIDTVVPMIDELLADPKKNKKYPNIYGVTDFSRGKKAAYESKTSGMIDTLIAAQSLPKVQASLDLVEQQIRRHSGESVSDYVKRLGDLKKDLARRRAKSVSVLENRQVNTAALPDLSHLSDEELHAIAAGGQ